MFSGSKLSSDLDDDPLDHEVCLQFTDVFRILGPGIRRNQNLLPETSGSLAPPPDFLGGCAAVEKSLS